MADMTLITATATHRHKQSPKRKKNHDARPAPPSTRRKHGSSSYTSSSSPITETARKISGNNSRLKVLSPPKWSSEEEDELQGRSDSDSDDDDTDELERKQKSSQLTERERKKIAMKRLKKARRDKGEKLSYFSPVYKSKLTAKSAKKPVLRRSDSDSEFDELATQVPASDVDTVAPMPWESDAEDEKVAVKLPQEPVYEEKASLKVSDDDLPPPLPQPERVWTRKARPPSRRDLFDATQRPAARRVSPSPPFRPCEESDDDLPELIPRSSSNVHRSQTSGSTPRHDVSDTEPSSTTLNGLASPGGLSRRNLMNGSPSTITDPSLLARPGSPIRESKDAVEEEMQAAVAAHESHELKPAAGLDELPYWEDNSFMEGDYSINDEDMDMANLQPFFTPSPPRKEPPQPIAGPSKSDGVPPALKLPAPRPDPDSHPDQDMAELIADAEREAEAEQETWPSQPQEELPPSNVHKEATSASATPQSAIVPKFSSSAKRARNARGVENSPSLFRSASRPLTGDVKGKGRAVYEDEDEGVVRHENQHALRTKAEPESEDDFSDFDELELTQVSKNQGGKTSITKSSPPNRRDDSPMQLAASTSANRRTMNPSPARPSSSKLPSSEEESQACPFCGNIYPIGSLPTHVEACQSAQVSAATSQAGKVGAKTFRYNDGPSVGRQIGKNIPSTSTKGDKGLSEGSASSTKVQADQLEALLFGQPSTKARQTLSSPPRRDKSKGRATDESGDNLTSPDVPLRQTRQTAKRAQADFRRSFEEDVIRLEDDEDVVQQNGHNWRSALPTTKRVKPIRAPDPQPASPPNATHTGQDVGSSPPKGSIFISKLPKEVQQGYFRLAGLDDRGQIATKDITRLIEQPRPLPTRAPPFAGRGRGRGGFRKPFRGRGSKSKKK